LLPMGNWQTSLISLKVNFKGKNGWTVSTSRMTSVRYIFHTLTANALSPPFDYQPLHEGARGGFVDVVWCLVERGLTFMSVRMAARVAMRSTMLQKDLESIIQWCNTLLDWELWILLQMMSFKNRKTFYSFSCIYIIAGIHLSPQWQQFSTVTIIVIVIIMRLNLDL
jgi:hypothetical protein